MDKPENAKPETENQAENSLESKTATPSPEAEKTAASRSLLADASDEYLFGDSQNGVTASELEEISSSLSNNMEDVVKLGRLAKRMNHISKLGLPGQCETGRPGKDLDIPRIGREDLQWALSDAGKEALGPRQEKERTSKETPDSEPADKSGPFGAMAENVKVEKQGHADGHDKRFFAGSRLQREDWRRIRAAMEFNTDGIDKILPDLALTENTDASRIRVRETERGTETYDPESGIRTMTVDGKTIAQVGRDVTVTREGDRTVYKQGDRVLFEQIGDKKIVTLKDNGRVEIQGTEATVYQDGKPGYKLNPNAGILERTNALFISARGAGTVEEALESARREMDLSGKDKPIVITRANGLTIVRDGKVIADFFNGTPEGQPQEATFFISQDRKLVRTGDGKVLIRAKGKADVELSREQIDFLLSKLGDKAEFISRTLKALDAGNSVSVDENLSLRMRSRIEGTLLDGPHTRDALRFAVGPDHFTTREQGNETRYDTEDGTLRIKTRSGEETVLTPTEKGIDVENRELRIKDGRVSFTSSDTVINDDGSVELGNGTRIDTSGDVHLTDGTRISAGSSLDKGEAQALNLPTEKSLEIYMNFARSLAQSVSARANSGSVSLSDVAMLKANMSIIANYMGFFSQLGNMQVVNSLRTSWSLVKASLDQAEPRMRKRRELEAQAEVGEKAPII